MSSHEESIQEHVEAVLKLLHDEEEDLIAKLASVRGRITQAEALRKSSDQVNLTESRTKFVIGAKSNFAVDPMQKYKDMTQPEILIQIAKDNGGVLRTSAAKAIMVQAGKIGGNPKNASSHIYQILRSPERTAKFGYQFQHKGPGLYELVAAGAAEGMYAHLFDDEPEGNQPFFEGSYKRLRTGETPGAGGF